MKISNLYKLEFLLPVLASVFYFFTVKRVVPEIGYAVFALAIGAYFFPVKLLFEKTFSGKQWRGKLTEVISDLIFSLLAVFSILILFGNTISSIKVSFEILSITNVLFAIYYSVIDNTNNTFVTHLGFTVLAAAILGI